MNICGGTGFIGSKYVEMFGNSATKIINRESRELNDDVLYFISTTHNFNIPDDYRIDVNTNLMVLMEHLDSFRKFSERQTFKPVFNFISSWFVYGENKNAKENSELNPKGIYSVCKMAAEKILIEYCNSFDLKYRIMRLPNVFGFDKNSTKNKNAVAQVAMRMMNGEDVFVQAGNMSRNFMDVEDCCRAINFCLEKMQKNDIINIGGHNLKFRDMVNKMTWCCGYDKEIKEADFNKDSLRKNAFVGNFVMNTNKLDKLGFKKEGLDRGLMRMFKELEKA